MRIFFALLLLCVFSAPASAEGVFVKKKADSVPEQILEQDKEQKSKDPHTSSAPTAGNTKVLANRYYANCLKQNGTLMSPESQKTFCACTAAKISQNMSAEEMRALSKDTDEGQRQRTRMTAMIYVPCMEYPTYDLIRTNCESDPAIKNSFKEYAKVCDCMAKGMSKYATDQSTRVVQEQIRQTGKANPDIAAILNGLLASESFQRKSEYYSTTCTQKHEFGW